MMTSHGVGTARALYEKHLIGYIIESQMFTGGQTRLVLFLH